MTGPDLSTAPVSNLVVAPPAVAQHQSADWGLVQAEQVDIIRHEPFSYEFKGPRHLLVASERAERYDGETLVDGLPRSNRRVWSRRMSFIPAGHRFYGWQKPRALTRSTFLYIDPLSPLLGSELRFTEVRIQATPVLFRSRYLGDCAEAEGAAAEFVSIPEDLCRSAGHRLGA